MSSDKKDKKKKLEKSDIKNYKDEYRLITDHIFFEGSQQLERNKFFMGINFTLFAALGYFIKDIFNESLQQPINSDIWRFSIVIPILGFFISMFWVRINNKVESHLYLRVERALELEPLLNYKIYISNHASSRPNEGPASWIIYEFIGYVFASIWLVLFSALLNQTFSLNHWCYAIIWSILLVAVYKLTDVGLTSFSKNRLVK
ncbi:MAG: hypothetical protein IIB94_10955 [Candidatus Marinimicrobia bacterium]|nr:hypothetical protein [Candidatus Neomarinimicrobiota bacterium]